MDTELVKPGGAGCCLEQLLIFQQITSPPLEQPSSCFGAEAVIWLCWGSAWHSGDSKRAVTRSTGGKKLLVQPSFPQPHVGLAVHGASMPSSGAIPATSHPARMGLRTAGLPPHPIRPGHGPKAELPGLEEGESREGGRKDAIPDVPNSFPLLPFLTRKGWENKIKTKTKN